MAEGDFRFERVSFWGEGWLCSPFCFVFGDVGVCLAADPLDSDDLVDCQYIGRDHYHFLPIAVVFSTQLVAL
jgi:hypothetical protein